MKRIFPGWALLLLCACGENGSSPFTAEFAKISGTEYLYVVSGSCYAGGVTTAAGPANSIARYDLRNGNLLNVIIDYNQLSPGDAPVAIASYDQDRILVLVENASGRRIDIVKKDGSSSGVFLLNSTALSAPLRGFTLLSDLSLLVSKNTAIEKFNSGKARVTSGAVPFVNNPAGACATTNTLVSSVTASTTGKIIYTHAGASPNNKIVVIKSTGYAIAGDCLSGLAAPATTALPTKAVFHPDGSLLVSYGSTTTATNYIYSYDYNDTTGVISGATVAFTDGGVLINGPSTMAIDPASRDVFVANGNSNFNNIERFRFSAGTLTRATTTPFIPNSIYTRCVADMQVMQ